MRRPLLTATLSFCPSLLSALLFLFSLSLPLHASAYKEVKDVNVWCDTSMRCTLSLSPKTFDGVTSLSLLRANKLNNALSLKFTSQVAIEDGTRFFLSIDGKDSLSLIADATSIQDNGRDYVETNPDVIDWVVTGMKSGATISVKQSGGGQSVTSIFSLSGSVAGMIFMDEYQDLLNTPYALQVKGSKAASQRLAISAVDNREQVPAVIWDKWFRDENAVCHFYNNSERLGFGDGFRFSLRAGDLYGLPCGSPGAYNQIYIFFHVPLDESQSIQMVPFILDGNDTAEDNGPDIWNIDFNASTYRLNSFFKGRGLGDCGTLSRWDLHEEGQNVFFEAVEIREKGECDGDYAGGPNNWPISWPVR
ncbi:DUF1176 domain-containing protein [Cohaesibacter celericrescens]|uniref:DUF1176 domain-containing protein n=1 Tax=Cohaesibacter celericrescens TaxID=2067669 RepID=A0A2N5XK32_9HYPH|nr:DUF1176 domain-containing protein [Cohaesibacter celericrescens]PLW74855.1 DUF1176 domain-containing protein [Cohaesibacter celericrescens]